MQQLYTYVYIYSLYELIDIIKMVIELLLLLNDRHNNPYIKNIKNKHNSCLTATARLILDQLI